MIDVEAVLKADAKTGLTLPAGRVFYSVPEGASAWPIVTLEQVGGAPEEGSPVEHPRISWSCWASTKETASLARIELLEYLAKLAGRDLGSDAHCYGVSFESVYFLRDPDVKLSRYLVDVTVHVGAR